MTAVVLLAHGSRDPRWADPVRALRARVGAARPGVAVVVAFLELEGPSVEDAIADLFGAGHRDVSVVPVFFGRGRHVRDELPRRLGALRAAWPQLELAVTPALGESSSVLDALASAVATLVGRAN